MNLLRLPENVHSVTLNITPSGGKLSIHMHIDALGAPVDTDFTMTVEEYQKAMHEIRLLGKYMLITAQGDEAYKGTVIIMTADRLQWKRAHGG